MLFALEHQIVHKLRYQSVVKLWVRKDNSFFRLRFPHYIYWLNLINCLFLGSFSTVFRPSLCPSFNTWSIKCTTDDVIPYTRQVFYPSSTDQHDGVLLKVVTFTRDVGIHLFLVGQPYPGNFPHGWVRLFGSGGIYPYTNAPALWTWIQCRRFTFLS